MYMAMATVLIFAYVPYVKNCTCAGAGDGYNKWVKWKDVRVFIYHKPLF